MLRTLLLTLLLSSGALCDSVTLDFNGNFGDIPVFLGSYYKGGTVSTGAGPVTGPNYGIDDNGWNTLFMQQLWPYTHQSGELGTTNGFLSSVSYDYQTPGGGLYPIASPAIFDAGNNLLASTATYTGTEYAGRMTVTFEGLASYLVLGGPTFPDASHWRFDNITFDDLVGYDQNGPITATPEPSGMYLISLALPLLYFGTRKFASHSC